MSIRPPLLKQGDKIGLVAPSRMITNDQIIAAKDEFKRWGLTLVEGEALYNKYGYFAGRDEERLEDIQKFIEDDSITAIFCARGGYGLTRIVDRVDLTSLVKNPKWIIGFSDITCLHLAMNKLGVESIHGLMPAQFGYDDVEKSIKSLYELLFYNQEQKISADQTQLYRNGSAKAELIGGNLSLVAESLGTPTEIETEGKILFVEEIDEYLYKIDRMFTQLRRAGKLSKLSGLIIGDFSGMKDTQIAFGKDIYNLIWSHVKDFDYPVAFHFPIGHESLNLAVPVGRTVRFEVKEKKAELTF